MAWIRVRALLGILMIGMLLNLEYVECRTVLVLNTIVIVSARL